MGARWVLGALTLKKATAGPGATRGPSVKANAKALDAGLDCDGASATAKISFTPSRSLSGHFATKVDKYNFLGAQIPTGASVDMGLTASIGGAAGIESDAEVSCSLAGGELFKTLVVDPVPISVDFSVSAEFTIGGGLDLDNVGLSANAGLNVKGAMSVKNGASITAGTTVAATPMAPKVLRNGSVGFKVGGTLILGPGVGTKEAGVIGGISGELIRSTPASRPPSPRATLGSTNARPWTPGHRTASGSA